MFKTLGAASVLVAPESSRADEAIAAPVVETGHMPTSDAVRYQFVIEGELTERAVAAFPELRRSAHSPTGTTTLYGELADNTAMRGVLARIDVLGLTLLGMSRLPD